jgi:hypothetical protein
MNPKGYFFYTRRARQEDGSYRNNDNYICFLPVISFYWDVVEGKNVLNIFTNGGTVQRDSKTGQLVGKAGYTITLPGNGPNGSKGWGEMFVEEYTRWASVFGLSTPVYIPQMAAEAEHPQAPAQPKPNKKGHRSVNEESFGDPAEAIGMAEVTWEGQ